MNKDNLDKYLNNEKIYNDIYNFLKENIINNNKYTNKEIINNLIDKKYLNDESNIKKINNYLDDMIYTINKDLKIKYINYKYDNINKIFNETKNYFNQNNIDFADYDKKSEFIEGIIDYYNQTKNPELEKILIRYFKEELIIKNRDELEQKQIESYKNDAKKIKEIKVLTPNDIEKYFDCLKEAIYSYDEKNLGKEYKFHSKDFKNSIHEGLSLDFSVPKKELPHLLGLKNPDYDRDSLMLKLYNNYLEENNLSHSDDNYFKYISLHLKEDIIKVLETNNTEIKELIFKSYNKCINFIQIYEYKKIPEIILDYDVIESYEGTFKENTKDVEVKPKIYSETNKKDHSKDLVTRANKHYNLDSKNELTIEELNYNNLSEEEKNFIDKIKEQFSNTDEIYIFKNNQKLDTSIIKCNNIIYEYKNNKFWSQLEPNIFIVSYNKKELKRKKKVIDNYQNETVLALCSTLKNDLRPNNGTIKVNTIEELYNILKTQISENKLNKILSNIYDEKRNHLINTKAIGQIIKLLDNYDISAIANEYNRKLYNDNDYKQLSFYMKDNFDDKISSKISRMFGFANNIAEKNKLIEEPPSIRLIHKLELELIEKKKNKEHIINNDVQIIGYSTIRNQNEKVIADIMTEEEKKKIPQEYQRLLYLTKSQFKEKYAKTLMGKTFLQLIYDLRINGWSYELDAISYKDKYFNCKLLIENPTINLKLSELIKDNPEIEHDAPKHTR